MEGRKVGKSGVILSSNRKKERKKKRKRKKEIINERKRKNTIKDILVCSECGLVTINLFFKYLSQDVNHKTTS